VFRWDFIVFIEVEFFGIFFRTAFFAMSMSISFRWRWFFIIVTIRFECFTFNTLYFFIANRCLTNITCFNVEWLFNLKISKNDNRDDSNSMILLTIGPRSEVKTGLELKCSLSREHVDKSLILVTCVIAPFCLYLYWVVQTPRTSSSRIFFFCFFLIKNLISICLFDETVNLQC